MKQGNLNKRHALPGVIVAGIIVNKIEEQFGAAHSEEVRALPDQSASYPQLAK
jgi:hypothetical protein